MSASERILDPIAIGSAVDTPSEVAALELEVLGLFDEYQRPLLRYAGSFGLGRQDAEDVVQDVFLALFRHLLGNRSRQNLPGWLFRVAHNLALKQRRRRRRRWWALGFESDPGVQRIDPESNPEERLADAQQQGRWVRILQALPERDRRCVLLRAEGMKYRDIATALDVSLGTVAKTMARVMTRLGAASEQAWP